MPVFDATGLLRRQSEALFSVRFVIGIVSLKPEDFAVTLEGKDVGGNSVKNQRSWLITKTHPEKISRASARARMVFTSRSFVGSSNRSTLAPSFQQTGKMHPVPFSP